MKRETLKSWAVIVLGCVLLALAFNWFFEPNQVPMGGITGLAQVIHHLVPIAPVGVLGILLNIPLFLLGWKFLGFRVLASSLAAMTISNVAIDLISVYPFAPIDPLLAAFCGGALAGLGLGLVFAQGTTTGGTDTIARLLKLWVPWLPMGKLMLIPDGVVLTLAAITFGSVESALYGVVSLVLMSRMVDTVLYGMDRASVAYIISDRWEEMKERMLGRQDRGVTVLQGRGGYTDREKQVLMVAFRQRDIVEIKRAVREVDPKAFMIVCEAHDVLGEGFGDYQKEDI